MVDGHLGGGLGKPHAGIPSPIPYFWQTLIRVVRLELFYRIRADGVGFSEPLLAGTRVNRIVHSLPSWEPEEGGLRTKAISAFAISFAHFYAPPIESAPA